MELFFAMISYQLNTNCKGKIDIPNDQGIVICAIKNGSQVPLYFYSSYSTKSCLLFLENNKIYIAPAFTILANAQGNTKLKIMV